MNTTKPLQVSVITMFCIVCAAECSEFDTLRPDKGKKQDSENMDDSAQDGKFIGLV